jgi:hypothetical protein
MLMPLIYTEWQTALASDKILAQQEHPVRRDVQGPGECSNGVAAPVDPGCGFVSYSGYNGFLWQAKIT